MATIDLKNMVPKILYGKSMPESGSYNQGDRVINIAPTADKPVGYWLRVTTGNTHLLGTDWIEK